MYFVIKQEIFTVSVLKGHADFAEEGSDIVCSAVSVLTINTINCIELLLPKIFECETDEKKRRISQP